MAAAKKDKGNLVATVEAMQRRALIKSPGNDSEKVLQLPLWPAEMRAIPNDYARSALFTVRNKKTPREAMMGHEVFHTSQDVQIYYTGIELRADDDELVWQQVLEYAKHFPLGQPVSFTLYQLCTDLDWPINGRYYQRAEECLDRLQASAIKFVSKRLGSLESLSMIKRYRMVGRGSRGARCEVEIDGEMVYLFAGHHYTQVVWTKYRKLSPVSRRLYDYLASHKEPYPLALDTFNRMCASLCNRPKKWAEMVRESCEELKQAGLVDAAWVHEGMIRAQR
ncbi:MAG TPA: plasmid replication initiator TrfA [Polaromonas sp.]|uniref:TrfA protein n=1 Tax=Fluviicoccus keumensis TaxID=1435465 RepID=A0A4Q7ZC14_9GAMM|nr:plasmid replication initiator TrfA [Fluviicoccus keumensis]RZU48158.1 TrfA protein [Fluviicoccus keumensis]HEX5285679.1 plasmid replication initiator TrfA [Polaromonas sp.]